MRIFAILMLIAFSQASYAQAETSYNVSFDNAAHHEAVISVTYKNIKTVILEARMSRSSPGRYALHEFAKNVYNVSAINSKGEPLKITRPDPYQWNIHGHDGEVTLTYTLFANRAGGTYSQVDRTHAHLNIPSTFMWAKGFEQDPIRVTFKPFDSSWKVATQLIRTKETYVLTAPNLYYFMDSPIELSDHMLREWKVGGQTIKLAVHHDGSVQEMNKYTEMAKAVVNAQKDVYGELPDFDYGEYVFLACYLPHVNGDGMEHRNSTVITSSSSLKNADADLIATLSHEFFHSWNVERIRPKSLEPFDFTSANMSESLWFAEGFTSYYGPLTLKRSGVDSQERFIEGLSYLVNAANNSTGRLYFSPEDSSKMATFTDAGTSIDKTNFSNIFFSYYTYGASVALALDLTIRAEFKGKTLDGYMTKMWTDFGKKSQPYTLDDLRATLGKYVGDAVFGDKFFAAHVSGKNVADYASLLKAAGLVVSQPLINTAYAGPVRFNFNNKTGVIVNAMKVGTPLYEAGLEQGDQIVSLAKHAIKSKADWDSALAALNVGDTVTISYISRGSEFHGDITIAGNPAFKVSIMADGQMTDAQRSFLADWTGGTN